MYLSLSKPACQGEYPHFSETSKNPIEIIRKMMEQPFDLIADKIVDILLRKINGEKISSSIVLPEIKLVRGMTT